MERLKSFLSSDIKKKQYLIAGAVLGVLVLVSSVLVAVGNNKAQEEVEPSVKKRITVSKVTGSANVERQLIAEYERKMKDVSEELKNQKAEKVLLESKLETLEGKIEDKEAQNGAQAHIDELAGELGRLREEIEMMRIEKAKQVHTHDQVVSEVAGRGVGGSKAIKVHEVSGLRGYSEHDLDKYIAAGSYAKAEIISGVDASVGVSAQGEPRPVLLRIMSKARNAAFKGEIQKADIEGCMISAASTGDLSSERVFMRLHKITCSRAEGKVFEADVQGYVAGVGKAGVRGDVVSREGDFVFKSFLAGVAGSAGNGISQKFATPMALPSGLATQRPEASDILNSSIGSGITSSTNRLSDYLIQRAEQYQPVISVPAGLEVEVVFNEGFYIEGRNEQTGVRNEKEQD